MQRISPDFFDELISSERLMPELIEFYAQEEEDFRPSRAALRLSNAAFEFAGFDYSPRLISRGEIRRYLSKQSNSVSLSFNNADLLFSKLLNKIRFEGLWCQIRFPSLRKPGESIIVFAGRAGKPSRCNHRQMDIQIVQDISGGDEQVPARKMTVLCPLASDFKGFACRGGVPLNEKPAVYRQAISCPGTEKACVDRANRENFQGVTYRPISGTFSYTVEEVKRFLYLFKRKKRRIVSAAWSSVSDANEDQVIPEIGGVVQVETIPVMHADTGVRVRALNFIADGEIDGVFEAKIRDKQYLPQPDFVELAYGKLGSQGQPEAGKFPNAGRFSQTAWIAFDAIGSDPADANDAAPTLTVIARGRIVDLPSQSGAFINTGWSDCGPYLTRWYLKNMGRMPASRIDDNACIEAALATFEPVIDDTGAEQAVLATDLTGGVDFKAFAAASGFGATTIDKIALMMAQGKLITGGYGQLVEAYYRYIDQNNLPDYIEPIRKVRRRYTSNYAINEQLSLNDFLHDILLPSFNGQLVFSADGKIQIKVDRAADSTLVVAEAASAATELIVESIDGWRRDNRGLILIGAHQTTAELNRVRGTRYASAATPINLVVASTGTLTIAAPPALAGGTDATPDNAVIVFGGTVSPGSGVTITIDGQVFDYRLKSGDDHEAVAGYLAAMINGHAKLRRYVRAIWDQANGLRVSLVARYGVLQLQNPLSKGHAASEETMRVAAAFGGDSPFDFKIVEDSFDWPLGSRQSSTNRATGKYRSAVNDWASTDIQRDAEAHQKQTRKRVSEELNLSAVDSAHQAARLLKIFLGKRRLCDWYCAFKATGAALLIDAGDVICVSHYSGAGYIRNLPVRVQDHQIARDQSATVTGQLYKSEVYEDTINEISPQVLMPLQQGAGANTDPGAQNPPTGQNPGDSGLGRDPLEPPYEGGDGGYGTGGGAQGYDRY